MEVSAESFKIVSVSVLFEHTDKGAVDMTETLH